MLLESEILKALALLGIGAFLKFAFDRWGAQLGWSREERKADAAKIERVDSHARAELGRIERELGGRVNKIEQDLGVLATRIESLPTADDFQALDQRMAALGRDLGRDLSGVISKVDGMNGTVKTILQHILDGERRR